jgi:hypothetical protein
MNTNPYESSREIVGAKTASPLPLPAIILLVLALLSAIKWIAGGAYAIFVLSRGHQEFLLGGLLDIAIGVVNIVICIGACLMLGRVSLRAAWVTAIVATIPCLSPCILIGMPIGIWIILLLRKPEVQAEFQAATKN